MADTGDDRTVLWNQMTAETLRQKAHDGALVLLPVASTEQHGPHLATGVDTILCAEACRRTAHKVAAHQPVVVAPTVWMGLAEHHVAFGGTFTVSLTTWHALLHDLCQAILRAGFEKILIVNGHGGNMAALNTLTTELTRELGAPIATTTYFIPATQAGLVAPLLDDQEGVIHACEAETSMMMVAAPDLVDETRLADAHGPQPSMGEVLSPALQRWRSFKDITLTGVLGDARRSTPEKGVKLLEIVSQTLADALIAGQPWDR